MTAPLAICHDYQELIVALRHRREALDLSYSAIDDIAGLPAAYTSKLLAMRPGRSLGKLSLGLILGTLGLKLAVLEDEEALSKVRGRFTKRRVTSQQHARESVRAGDSAWGRGMQAKWMSQVSPRQRSALARRAARARWARQPIGR
jgi:hypothetical protein